MLQEIAKFLNIYISYQLYKIMSFYIIILYFYNIKNLFEYWEIDFIEFLMKTKNENKYLIIIIDLIIFIFIIYIFSKRLIDITIKLLKELI